MGFFDDQIDLAADADALRKPWDDFRQVFREGYGPANPVSDEYAPIIADFLHRIPTDEGVEALWTLDPDGDPYFFFLPSTPAKPGPFEGKTYVRSMWEAHLSRVDRMRSESRPARVLTIWLSGEGSGEYEAALFARKIEGPWIAVQGNPASSWTGRTLWATSGSTWKVIGPLTEWLRSRT